jgi:hypothetical protein
MRLHASRVGTITREIVDTLLVKELVEIDPTSRAEVELDVESVLKEYLRTDRQLTDEAKDLAAERGLDYTQHQKIKKQLAEKRRFGIHDDAIAYVANQLIETLLHTGHVSEVFAEDHDLRAAIAPVLKRHMSTTDPLDEEVRKQIKNLQEGTADWEIRYQQQMERIRRLKGLG